jgi:hypothetical protein
MFKKIFNEIISNVKFNLANENGAVPLLVPVIGMLLAGAGMATINQQQTPKTNRNTQTNNGVTYYQDNQAGAQQAYNDAARGTNRRPAGLYGSADSMERQLNAGRNNVSGANANANAGASTVSSYQNPNILPKATLAELVRSKFSAIGITGSDLNELVNSALSSSDLEYGVIFSLLEGTSAYKNRFAGNKLLEQKGLAPLDEATYLNMERNYTQALSNYEEILPPSMKIRDSNGNYRSPKDFVASWIGNQVSVDEIEKRLLAAKDYAKSADPNLKTALKNYYGIGEDQIAQYALSTEQDLDTFIKQYSTVKIGSEALAQGLDVNRSLAEELVSKDISTEQARQGFGEVAAQKETYGVLSGIEGANLTQEEMIQSELGLNADAAKKARTLRSQEESRFTGTGGGTNILGGTVSGSL